MLQRRWAIRRDDPSSTHVLPLALVNAPFVYGVGSGKTNAALFNGKGLLTPGIVIAIRFAEVS